MSRIDVCGHENGDRLLGAIAVFLVTKSVAKAFTVEASLCRHDHEAASAPDDDVWPLPWEKGQNLGVAYKTP